jgi:hypothetical protein
MSDFAGGDFEYLNCAVYPAIVEALQVEIGGDFDPWGKALDGWEARTISEGYAEAVAEAKGEAESTEEKKEEKKEEKTEKERPTRKRKGRVIFGTCDAHDADDCLWCYPGL